MAGTGMPLHVDVVVSPADSMNTGRFFPGHFLNASGTLSGRSISLRFDNGTSVVGSLASDGSAIAWPNGCHWTRLPAHTGVKRLHIVQSCHLDIGPVNH